MTRCSFLTFAASLSALMGCQLIGGFEDHELQDASTTTLPQGGSGGENTGGTATAGSGQGGGAAGPGGNGGDGGTGNIAIEPYCGDGTVDPGEVCDDENDRSGDGCSADCAVECGDPNANEGTYALHPDTNHCYRFDPSDVTWTTAQDACAGWGGTLAVVTSDEENEFITASLPLTTGNWIGAQDLDADGLYVWDNDERFNYHAFDGGTEVGKCSVMRNDLTWYTFNCAYLGKPFVCERSVGLP